MRMGETIKVAAGSGRIWGFTLIYQVEEENNLTTLFLIPSLVLKAPCANGCCTRHHGTQSVEGRGRRHPSFKVARAPATASHPPPTKSQPRQPPSPSNTTVCDMIHHIHINQAERSPAQPSFPDSLAKTRQDQRAVAAELSRSSPRSRDNGCTLARMVLLLVRRTHACCVRDAWDWTGIQLNRGARGGGRGCVPSCRVVVS